MGEVNPDWDKYDVNLGHLFETEPMQRSRMEEIAHYSYGLVLEVGAHDGFVSWLCKGQGKEVVTTDISRASCIKAKARGLDVLVCDVRFLPFRNGLFDTVMAGEVLEHLTNMGYGLTEIQRVSKKRVIISLPHEFWKGDPTHVWQIWFRGVKLNGDKFSGDSAFGFTILIMDKKAMDLTHEWLKRS